MKTISKILSIVAAFGALLLVSCRNDNTSTQKVTESKLETPGFAEQTVVVNFKTDTASEIEKDDIVPLPAAKDEVIADDETKVLTKAEFTNSGYAILTTDIVPKAVDPNPKSKAGEDKTETIIEKYTYVNGVYVIENFGTIKIGTDGKIEVTVQLKAEDEPVVVKVEPKTVEEAPQTEQGSVQFNLCRSWTVDRIVVSVKGGQLGEAGAGVVLDANTDGVIDLGVVAKKLKDLEVKIPDNIALEEYNIVDINFTEFNTFVINFAKAKPFTGVFSLKSKEFEYTLSGTQGNSIINGTAKGSVDFKNVDNVDFCYFNISGKIESGSDKYTSTIEFTLKEKK